MHIRYVLERKEEGVQMKLKFVEMSYQLNDISKHKGCLLLRCFKVLCFEGIAGLCD